MKVAFNPVVNFKQNLLDEKRTSFQNGEVSKPEDEGYSNQPISEAAATEDKFTSNISLEKKVADFQSALKDRKWEKKYLPESDLVFIKQKKVEDGIEYILEKDGTVRETGADLKSTVIMEPSSKMAKEFAQIKSNQYEDPKEEKPGNFLTRGISNILTFFSVAGTMAAATVKGLYYGAITGAGVVVASTVLKLPELLKEGSFWDACKNPLKSAGKGGRIVAAVGSLAVLASYIISGRLSANEKAAGIDHKWLGKHWGKLWFW